MHRGELSGCQPAPSPALSRPVTSLTSQLFPPELAAHYALLTKEQIQEEVLRKFAEFKKMPLPLLLTPSTTYPAYGMGGKLLNRTYKPTPFDKLITKAELDVARLEEHLHEIKQDLAGLHEVRFSLYPLTIPPQPQPSLLPWTSHCPPPPPRCTCKRT